MTEAIMRIIEMILLKSCIKIKIRLILPASRAKTIVKLIGNILAWNLWDDGKFTAVKREQRKTKIFKNNIKSKN